MAEVGIFGADLEEALYVIRRAKLLHPHHTSDYDHIVEMILFQLGQDDAAVPFLEGSETKAGTATLMAAYGNLGNPLEAARIFGRSGIWRDELRQTVNAALFRFKERRDRLVEGLEKASLLE